MKTEFRGGFKYSALLFTSLLLISYCVFPQSRTNLQPDIWKNEALVKLPGQLSTSSWYNEYDNVFTKLDLHLERNTVYVEGNVLNTVRSRVPGLYAYRCELISNLVVDSVKYNAQPATFVHSTDTIIVTLIPQPELGELFSVQVFYHGLPPTGGFFAGITTAVSTTWGNEVTWTMSQPFNAYQWWPCKQDLMDKYDSAWVFITTDAANKAGSNGLLMAVTPMPGNKLRYEWKEKYPIDYYLISAAVADYQEYNIYAHPEGSPDSILIQNFIYDAPGCLEFYKNDLNLTPYFLELFAHLFGPYPFDKEKYGHCQSNLGGGMEHQTMGTLGAFNFHLNSHELAHQWFGDHVTCASWSDIWLNEGFATYGQYLALQYLTVQAYADTFMMSIRNYVMTEPGGSVYIPPAQANDVSRIFNGRLSYNKGAAIIQALRGEINNDTEFFNIIKQFMQNYGDSVAVGLDFKHVAENVSGQNLDDFFDQWYFGEGYPIFDILYGQSADTLIISMGESTSSAVTPFFKMHLEMKVQTMDGDTLLRIFIDQPDQVLKIYMPHQVTGLIPDPHYFNVFKVNSLNRINDSQLDERLVLYPNPWNNELHYFITISEPGPYVATFYDLQGKEVSQVQLNSRTGILYPGNISNGLYSLQISGKGFNIFRKIVRQ